MTAIVRSLRKNNPAHAAQRGLLGALLLAAALFGGCVTAPIQGDPEQAEQTAHAFLRTSPIVSEEAGATPQVTRTDEWESIRRMPLRWWRPNDYYRGYAFQVNGSKGAFQANVTVRQVGYRWDVNDWSIEEPGYQATEGDLRLAREFVVNDIDLRDQLGRISDLQLTEQKVIHVYSNPWDAYFERRLLLTFAVAGEKIASPAHVRVTMRSEDLGWVPKQAKTIRADEAAQQGNQWVRE